MGSPCLRGDRHSVQFLSLGWGEVPDLVTTVSETEGGERALDGSEPKVTERRKPLWDTWYCWVKEHRCETKGSPRTSASPGVAFSLLQQDLIHVPHCLPNPHLATDPF